MFENPTRFRISKPWTPPQVRAPEIRIKHPNIREQAPKPTLLSPRTRLETEKSSRMRTQQCSKIAATTVSDRKGPEFKP